MVKVYIAGSIAFGISLTLLVGSHLSDQVLVVVAGALCGMATSIPITALMLYFATQEARAPAPQLPMEILSAVYVIRNQRGEIVTWH